MNGARELLRWAVQELQSATQDPALDAQILLAEVTGLSRTHVLFRERFEVDEEAQFRDWIGRRQKGEPIQYITGRAYFRNLTLEVGPGVLIPRPESEQLVADVISKIAGVVEACVVDLGAGSGALTLSIATELSNVKVTAVEREGAAISWLERNVKNLGALVNHEIEIIRADVMQFDGKHNFDVVIANPPYIPDTQELPKEVVDFEPRTALFGGPEGLDAPQVFIAAALRALKPGGYLAIEHHEDQGEAICEILERSFESVHLHYDLNGRARFSSGVLK